MSWREELRRVQHPDGRTLIGASFRGVPFFIEDSDRGGGRRMVTHEFPFRDDPVIVDLGRRMRTFAVVGYVLGEDYLADKLALISALEDSAEAGQLIHPYYAQTIRAHCDEVTTSERKREGGIATLSMRFVEAPTLATAPVVVDDLDSLVESAALIALEIVVVDLDNTYSVAGQPAFATESLQADANAIATTMGQLLGPVVSAASELQQTAEVAIQELAALDAEIKLFINDVVQLVKEPTDLFERLTNIIQTVTITAEAAPREVYLALLGVYDTLAQLVAVGDTPTREQERANQVALGGAMREQQLFAAASLIVDVEYQSIEDAEADREQLLTRLDAQILVATDPVYPRLLDVRATVTKAVPGDEELASILDIERRISIPSLVLSHELYGSIDGDTDILGRNPTIQHPGFVLGELKVLSAI